MSFYDVGQNLLSELRMNSSLQKTLNTALREVSMIMIAKVNGQFRLL